MDQKHRDYCIRLGNPYYTNEKEQQYDFAEPSIEDFFGNEDNDNFNLQNSSKKFTN